MKATFALAAAALLAGSATASAQTAPGPYAGGLIGYNWGEAEARLSVPVGNARLVARETVDYDGWDLGGYVGYRFATRGGFALALEGGGLWSGADGAARDTFGGRDLRTSVEKSSEFYLSAKGGIPVQGVAVIYGIAGLQAGDFDTRVRNVGEGRTLASKSASVGGWHLGLGAEYFLMNNLSTRLEWKHQSYGDYRISGDGGRVRVEPSENTLRLGVSYSF